MSFIDSIGSSISGVLSWLLALLPDSPFQSISNSDVSSYLGTLNWFIPLAQIVAILELWLIAVLTFYIYSIILRWIRAIE